MKLPGLRHNRTQSDQSGTGIVATGSGRCLTKKRIGCWCIPATTMDHWYCYLCKRNYCL